MNKVMIFGLVVVIAFGLMPYPSAGQSQNDAHPDLKKRDTLKMTQKNGPTLHVVGYGKLHLSYSETMDGYTILRNKQGVYEYAERAGGGDLKTSGMVAHDPGEREQKEITFLSRTKKHLRYKPPKLNEILEKQNRFFRLDDD